MIGICVRVRGSNFRMGLGLAAHASVMTEAWAYECTEHADMRTRSRQALDTQPMLRRCRMSPSSRLTVKLRRYACRGRVGESPYQSQWSGPPQRGGRTLRHFAVAFADL